MKAVFFAGLSALLAVSGISPAFAGGSYDGQWSVQMVTVKGNCDHSLSWDVGVASSRIAESGAFGQATGAVDARGRVRLMVVNGADRVSASGKLSGASGGGVWISPTRACSGHWRAERRA